jgi:hypothetical protein
VSEPLTARVKNGNVNVEQHEHGFWLVSWDPDEGHPDFPGHTYSPKDPHLPSDYPGLDITASSAVAGEQIVED